MKTSKKIEGTMAGILLLSCKQTLQNVPKRLRWSRGSILAFGTEVRGFAPGRSRRIFRAKKSLARLPSVPCRKFKTCKRSINITWKSKFRQNSRTYFAHSSTFGRWVLSRGYTRGDAWWHKLERLTQIAQ
jgi:hypothetical protein